MEHSYTHLGKTVNLADNRVKIPCHNPYSIIFSIGMVLSAFAAIYIAIQPYISDILEVTIDIPQIWAILPAVICLLFRFLALKIEFAYVINKGNKTIEHYQNVFGNEKVKKLYLFTEIDSIRAYSKIVNVKNAEILKYSVALNCKGKKFLIIDWFHLKSDIVWHSMLISGRERTTFEGRDKANEICEKLAAVLDVKCCKLPSITYKKKQTVSFKVTDE